MIAKPFDTQKTKLLLGGHIINASNLTIGEPSFVVTPAAFQTLFSSRLLPVDCAPVDSHSTACIFFTNPDTKICGGSIKEPMPAAPLYTTSNC